MNAHTSVIGLNGAAGRIDIAVDRPVQGPVRGIAVIAHPHPLYGGTRDNKVVQTMARALLTLGFVCWRPDFRGVGDSAGVHDEGRGETDDLLAVVEAARASEADAQSESNPESNPEGAALALVLAGFSFGTFVLSRVAARLADAGTPASRLVFIGTAASRFTIETVPSDTLVIHGELDDTVPLQSVLDWARPQELPVVVIPGADHFFHHRLTTIKQLLLREMR
jgi:alpha/beta superfamily hydrolase